MTFPISNIIANQVAVSRGNQIETISTWGKHFSIEADITINTKPNNWCNVFHFTKGGDNWRQHGNRIPSMWIHKDNKFYIMHSVQGNSNHYSRHSVNYGQKFHLLVHQYQNSNGKDYFEIKIDNQSVHLIENTDARDWSNVKVYVSDPWYISFGEHGTIENFVYCGGCGSPGTSLSNGERTFINCNPTSPIAT